ncbi:MAG: zinc ribbon domain-containing protein [Chloroflexi bacterium]|nr:zinc ribbon domain-containing protein [Chloroflexota bacterium]
MPIYEYRCASCDLKSSFFTRSVYVEVNAVCSHCGGEDMQRLISRVSFKMGSGGTRGTDYYSDSSNIGRNVEKNFERFGVDMPESVRGMIDDARKGKMPEGLDL